MIIAGVTVSSKSVIVVVAKANEDSSLTILDDQTLPLQNGERPSACNAMYNRIRGLIEGAGVSRVFIKGSAPMRGMRGHHLEAAEIRGIAYAASAAVAATRVLSRQRMNAAIGDRNTGDYIRDDDFFEDSIGDGALRRGSREAALLAIVGARGV